jgi:hypothetical protein
MHHKFVICYYKQVNGEQLIITVYLITLQIIVMYLRWLQFNENREMVQMSW